MTMSRWIAGLAAALTLTIAAVPAANARTTPRLLGCETARVRPSWFNPICNDGSGSVLRLHWSRWSGSADGRGQFFMHICSPNCAQGKVTLYPVRVSAWRVRNGVYTRFGYTFLRAVPAGFARSWTIAWYAGTWHGRVV
jgi:hypothetical protein